MMLSVMLEKCICGYEYQPKVEHKGNFSKKIGDEPFTFIANKMNTSLVEKDSGKMCSSYSSLTACPKCGTLHILMDGNVNLTPLENLKPEASSFSVDSEIRPTKLTEGMLGKALENDIPDKLWHDLRNRFTYHTPKEGQPQRYEDIRNKALNFADLICMNCPDSRERSLALTKIEEAVFWSNAAIARNEK